MILTDVKRIQKCNITKYTNQPSHIKKQRDIDQNRSATNMLWCLDRSLQTRMDEGNTELVYLCRFKIDKY
jgi:hypothetical protein